jgi:hypothetical protein
VSHWEIETYGEVAGADTVAAVACVLIDAGVFFAIAIPAGEDDWERQRLWHFEVCLKARTAPLAEFDLSMLTRMREDEKRN